MPKPKTKEEFIKNLKAIYASFEVKDLTEAEFIKQMTDLHDPNKMFNDLSDMELKLARERLNKMRIDKAVKSRQN